MTWMKNRHLINGLWPDADFTEQERELFGKAFQNLNQEWLKEAIERAAMNNMGKKPYVAWIKSEFQKIKAEKAAPSFHDSIHKKTTQGGQREIEFERVREKIRGTDSSALQASAEVIHRKTGIKIDITEDVEGWSFMALGMMEAQLTKGNQ